MIIGFAGHRPIIPIDAWTSPAAHVIGDVRLGSLSSVWYGAVLRADQDSIVVGGGSNIQDGAILHTDPGHSVRIGAGVSVGHAAIVHGCTIEDDVLIGMGAIIMNGALVGRGSLVAAGAVVVEGAVIAPGSLVAGIPAKIRRELTPEELEDIRANAKSYVALSREHAAACVSGA